ncbi:hypothetical protein MRS44_007021 [Fusarium solani]|uniref:uncharacterized protein n=1 Tax=Fusarium solani TaxID=169388 RepID=UPI0032C41B52|nr:hypothetical protein MRS44_007021 [Fusarium solani]
MLKGLALLKGDNKSPGGEDKDKKSQGRYGRRALQPVGTPSRLSIIAEFLPEMWQAMLPGSSMPVHKPMRWLRFAIQVYEQTKKSPFLIGVGNSLSDPTLNNFNDIWMVDTPSPAENGYSAAVRAYLGPFSVERHPPPRPATRHGSTPDDASAIKQILVSRFLDRQEALTPYCAEIELPRRCCASRPPLAAKQELLSWARHHAIEWVPALSGACQQPEVSQSVYLWKGNQHNPEATTAAHRLEKKETPPNIQEVISRECAGLKEAMRLDIQNAIQAQAAATKGSLAEQVRQAVKETMEDAQPQNQDYQVTLSQLRDILQKLQDAKVSPNCNIEGRAETNQHSQHVVSGLGQIDSDVATPMSMIHS